MTVRLTKEGNALTGGLGLSFTDSGGGGNVITQVKPKSAADKNGNIRAGMRIVMVNGADTRHLNKKQVTALIKQLKTVELGLESF